MVYLTTLPVSHTLSE